MTMIPYVSPRYEPGPAIAESPALLAWLTAHPGRVRLPFVVGRGDVGFSGRGARLGGADGALVVDLDDTSLGVSLAERCRQRAPHAEVCAVWLEGRWRGERDGRHVFAVLHVGESIADLATATHAEGEVAR